MRYVLNAILFPLILIFSGSTALSQDKKDTVGRKVITLSEVVVSRGLQVPEFIARIREDSSFYKAFRNLRILGYTAMNDIRMMDKKNRLCASLRSKTKQYRESGCRRMQVLEETSSGDFYRDDSSYNYYTADMYASLFLTKGSICGEDNIVGKRDFSTSGKKGMEKHKEQLKMLFFNPGKRINGLPFMSAKTEIFDDEMARFYDFSVDAGELNETYCYILHQKVKPGFKNRAVIDEMKTWFNDTTLEVVARHYSLSFNAAAFDYRVDMQVEMGKAGLLTVPVLIRYVGNWKVITKKRERGIFTATLSDFNGW
jgi:hypothetical protein